MIKIINKIRNNIFGFLVSLMLLNKKKYIDVHFKIFIKRLERTKYTKNDRYSYQKEYNEFNISEKDKVLDIGSGGYPFPLATHIADLYDKDTTHRTEKLIKDKRPFINCDIENLPFKDKEFDFIYCSHLLEHVNDPAKACKELMRVGKKGYIETPTRTSDIMFNFLKLKNHHKWYIHVINNTVIFLEWSKNERKDLKINYFFDQYHSKWNNPFQSMVYENRELFNNMYMWEKSFDFIIVDSMGRIIDLSTNLIN